jgi:hypothetical protein
MTLNPVEQVCRAVLTEREDSSTSVWRVFEEAAPDLSDETGFVHEAESYLRRHPDLVDLWDLYCINKRWTPSWLVRGREVGYVNGSGIVRPSRIYEDEYVACAEFVLREAAHLIEKRDIYFEDQA